MQEQRILVLHAICAVSAPRTQVLAARIGTGGDVWTACPRTDMMNCASRMPVLAALHHALVAVAVLDCVDDVIDLGPVERAMLKESDVPRAEDCMNKSFDVAVDAFGIGSVLQDPTTSTNPKNHQSKHLAMAVSLVGSENDTCIAESKMGSLARAPANVTSKRRRVLSRDTFGRIRFFNGLCALEEDLFQTKQLRDTGSTSGALALLYGEDTSTVPEPAGFRDTCRRWPMPNTLTAQLPAWCQLADLKALQHHRRVTPSLQNHALIMLDRLPICVTKRNSSPQGLPPHPPAYYCCLWTYAGGTDQWYDHVMLRRGEEGDDGAAVVLAQLRAVFASSDDMQSRFLLVHEYTCFEARDAIKSLPLIRRRRRLRRLVPGRGMMNALSVFPAAAVVAPAFVVPEVYEPDSFSLQVAPYTAFKAFSHAYPNAWWRSRGAEHE